MNNALGFVKMASSWPDSDRIILIPEPSDEGVYDVHIDSYRHRTFNYFTDIICNRRLEELDATAEAYRRLKDMHRGM